MACIDQAFSTFHSSELSLCFFFLTLDQACFLGYYAVLLEETVCGKKENVDA